MEVPDLTISIPCKIVLRPSLMLSLSRNKQFISFIQVLKIGTFLISFFETNPVSGGTIEYDITISKKLL